MSSIKRAIQVLDLLARKGGLGARAVAQQLSLPVGSVHRLLIDLSDEGVVERNAEGGWQLSYRLLAITDLQLDGVAFPRLARPFCESIAEKTRETVNVNVLSGEGCVCIDKVRGNEGMQLDMRIGSRGPLNCGGAGKAMLSYMPEARREEVYTHPLPALTSHTIVAADRLREEIGRIRHRFYSIDDQEVVMGVYCVAVPLLDRSGHSVGAMSVTGPSVKKPGADNVMPVVALLWDACEHVSRRLGYAGEWPPTAAAAATRLAG